jgi:uncharacterized protein involved in exopolysaccharide biosynthesis
MRAIDKREDELDLVGFLRLFWQRKWLIAGLVAMATAIAVTWALLATEWYRADTVLAPVTDSAQSASAGQLAGLVAFAGLGSRTTRSAEAIAVLRSREFLGAFVRTHGLAAVLAAGDDRPGPGNSASQPVEELQQAVNRLREKLLRVSEDGSTGLVTVSLEWTDPQQAAEWTNLLVAGLNETMRERMLSEATANVEFLRAELESTTVVTLQQAIGRLLENELQKLMVVRGSEEAAFRVLDRADPPRRPVRPNRPVIVILGASLGLVLGLFWASVAAALRD